RTCGADHCAPPAADRSYIPSLPPSRGYEYHADAAAGRRKFSRACLYCDPMSTSGTLPRATTSLCNQCRRSVPAELRRSGDAVVMAKRCPEHGEAEVMIASSAAWYAEVMSAPPSLTAPAPLRAVAQGCPFDCGPCASHQQRMELPIVPITSACNLDCPICYTHNRNEGAYHMSEQELGAILSHLRHVAPERRIINL